MLGICVCSVSSIYKRLLSLNFLVQCILNFLVLGILCCVYAVSKIGFHKLSTMWERKDWDLNCFFDASRFILAYPFTDKKWMKWTTMTGETLNADAYAGCFWKSIPVDMLGKNLLCDFKTTSRWDFVFAEPENSVMLFTSTIMCRWYVQTCWNQSNERKTTTKVIQKTFFVD